jgi:hypothetical protein
VAHPTETEVIYYEDYDRDMMCLKVCAPREKWEKVVILGVPPHESVLHIMLKALRAAGFTG